jgi:sentrin-specific protease 7
MRRLEPCVYLNDNLIDLRVKNLVAKLSDERRKKIHAFSCLFYGKLTEVNDGGKAAHSLVSRWTKSLDLFSLDFVLIPINFAMHWSLCVLVRPGELLVSNR